MKLINLSVDSSPHLRDAGLRTGFVGELSLYVSKGVNRDARLNWRKLIVDLAQDERQT